MILSYTHHDSYVEEGRSGGSDTCATGKLVRSLSYTPMLVLVGGFGRESLLHAQANLFEGFSYTSHANFSGKFLLHVPC